MRRRRSTADNFAVSLFPFLAVLICTMGVLIIMLVMAVKSSHVRAADTRREYEETVAANKEQLLDELDLQLFRVDEYEAMQPALHDRLAAQRSRRSHLEESTRRLIDQAKNLEDSWKRTENAAMLSVNSRNDEDTRIKSLESSLTSSQNELSALRKQVAGRPVLYSIVPTNTAGGTGRRPIYVECRPDGILLQPGGIRISLDDFTLPVVAGNPLDTALLATREHWKRYDVVGTEGDPYPLLVIRPGGATAYAIARRAMTSWDDEFGYELLDSRIEIDWGQKDKELDSILRQAIADAQIRQRQLVATRQVQWLGQSPANGAQTQSGPRGGAGSSESEGNDTPFGDGNTATFAETQNGNRSSDTSPEQASNPSPKNALRAGRGTAENDGRKSGGSAKQGTEISSSANPQGGDASKNSQVTGNSKLSATTSNAGSGSASTMKISPLAETRGQDWALPSRTPGATAYRRPIRVDCTESSFVVHSSDPGRPVVNVPVSESIDNSIDALINQVWTQIDEWGMAEAGGFWKPVLRLSASAQATVRAAELERKLDGSGIEIERLWR